MILGSAVSIRRQLIGLFGLMLVAGVTVLMLDEWERHATAQVLQSLKDDSLTRLRRIKAVSDAYALDYVDTTFRVRNDLISWEEGIQVVDNAHMRIDAHWRALEAVPQDPQQRILFGQIAEARKLDLSVVAEGVESVDEWQLLAQLGCDVAQGFLIAAPVPGDELAAAIARWRATRH